MVWVYVRNDQTDDFYRFLGLKPSKIGLGKYGIEVFAENPRSAGQETHVTTCATQAAGKAAQLSVAWFFGFWFVSRLGWD